MCIYTYIHKERERERDRERERERERVLHWQMTLIRGTCKYAPRYTLASQNACASVATRFFECLSRMHRQRGLCLCLGLRSMSQMR